MKISLKTSAKKQGHDTVVVILQNRLPAHMQAPCEMSCTYRVEPFTQDYLLSTTSRAQCQLTCQRCLAEFTYLYEHEAKLIICADEKRADELMSSYDSIVSDSDGIDLAEILTDDLHLFMPTMHIHAEECDSTLISVLNLSSN